MSDSFRRSEDVEGLGSVGVADPLRFIVLEGFAKDVELWEGCLAGMATVTVDKDDDEASRDLTLLRSVGPSWMCSYVSVMLTSTLTLAELPCGCSLGA